MKLAFKLSSAALLVAASISAAQAGGFMLTEQSVVNQGRAFAGAGISGDDLSAVWFNPAGMTLLPGTSAQIGATLISLNLKAKSTDGTQTDNGRDKEMPIPSAYFVHQLSPDMWLGLGITTPFGLSTSYSDTWGQDSKNNKSNMYDSGMNSEIKVFNFNPSLAWKATDKLSVGAGVSIEYATAKYRTGTYDPTVGKTLAAMAALGNPSVTLSKDEQNTLSNAVAKLDADGWAWGFNFGVMWEPTDTVRLGLAYRSSINHKVNGDTTINFNSLGAFADQFKKFGFDVKDGQASTVVNGKAAVKAPQTAMLTGTWQTTPKLRLSGLVRWTDWSSFDTLRIDVNGDSLKHLAGAAEQVGQHPSPNPGMTVQNHWKDTWLFSIGADYDINEQFTVRGGVGYETSAVDDPRYRSPLIPDMNRLMLAAGLTWRPTKNLQGDFAFTYLKGLGNADLYKPTRNDKDMAEYDYKDKWGEFTDMHAYMFGAQMVYHF